MDLEDRPTRRNLRIDGVTERKGETWKNLRHSDIFKEKLGLQNIDIERAKGKTSSNKPRTVACQLLSYK